jgi:hypothetical protein
LKTQYTRLAPILGRYGLLVVALLLLAGHLAPWAAHRTAALTLSGHELAVFTNFTPGAGIFLNEWFYLPLWAATLLLALVAGQLKEWSNRLLVALLSMGIASLGLPGYPQMLTAFREPDYQLQFFISLLVMVLAATVAMSRVGRRAAARAGAALAAAALSAMTLAGYVAVKPFIEQLYRDSVGLGLGWWLTAGAALLALGVAVALRPGQAVVPVSRIEITSRAPGQ